MYGLSRKDLSTMTWLKIEKIYQHSWHLELGIVLYSKKVLNRGSYSTIPHRNML